MQRGKVSSSDAVWLMYHCRDQLLMYRRAERKQEVIGGKREEVYFFSPPVPPPPDPQPPDPQPPAAQISPKKVIKSNWGQGSLTSGFLL